MCAHKERGRNWCCEVTILVFSSYPCKYTNIFDNIIYVRWKRDRAKMLQMTTGVAFCHALPSVYTDILQYQIWNPSPAALSSVVLRTGLIFNDNLLLRLYTTLCTAPPPMCFAILACTLWPISELSVHFHRVETSSKISNCYSALIRTHARRIII